MGLDRRSFMKTLGIAGATLAVGKSMGANQTNGKKTEFFAVLYDSVKCVGCHGCEFDCADAHGLPYPEDIVDNGRIRKTDETRRTVVNGYNTSKGKVFRKTQCMHCMEPACAAACLTQAMHKTKEGPVIWRGEKCMGCRYCMLSCPFDVPKFEYLSANPKIEKCSMCYELMQKGETPACVYNCPQEALKFGTRRDMLKEARKRILENPKNYYDHIYGEHEAGGTNWLYLSPVPFTELGLPANLQKSSYPHLTKGFLYGVPSVFVLWPAILLGIHEATKKNHLNEE